MKTDRNGKCPCGSNKKYKKCCINSQVFESTGSKVGVHKVNDGKGMIVDPDVSQNAKWIQLPPELGSERKVVISRQEVNCRCGKHTTTAIELEGGYICAFCDDIQQYMFAYKK